MRSVFGFKFAGTVILCGVALYAVVLTPPSALPIGLMLVVSLLALHSIRDRDYAREPMTAAESDYMKAAEKRKTVQALIDHLETVDHMNDDCAPCPVPDVLRGLKLSDNPSSLSTSA